MPEGDTYAHTSDLITPVLVGVRIQTVEGSSPSVRRRSPQMLDRRVTTVRTHGKHVVVDLDSGFSIHVHLGMSGRVQVTPPGRPRGGDRGAVRLALTTERGTVWVAAAPTVEVDRRPVIDRMLARLGPDLLAPEFDLERFRELAGRYPTEGSVCDFLLDQRVMAGIGNEYKCEVLFLEGVAPERSIVSLTLDQREALARRARALMLPNAGRFHRSTTGRADGSRWVYGRAGQPCRRCRTAILEDWFGRPPRVTYWCPTCQK